MNTTAKHTPGPWKVNSKHDATSGGRTFVVLYEAKPGYHARLDSTYKGEFTEANAALIAAAPTMLDELRLILRAAANPDGSVTLGIGDLDRIQGIADKAEGR